MAPSGERLRLPLSVDWEDWYQLCIPPFDAADAPRRFPDRLEGATEAVLELCEAMGATATWFCLADQALRHPALLRRIAAAGHRVALHGLHHRRAFEMERPAFRAELLEGRAILEELCGSRVEGFRAPEWSLRGRAEAWWRELEDLGFRYDASRAGMALLGCARWPRRAHRLGRLAELPPPVAGWGAWALPLWGWGARVLPEAWLRERYRRRALDAWGTPFVLHPWELDEGQPSLDGAPLGHRVAHGLGLEGYGARLRRLLAGFELMSLEDWLDLAEPAGWIEGTLEP